MTVSARRIPKLIQSLICQRFDENPDRQRRRPKPQRKTRLPVRVDARPCQSSSICPWTFYTRSTCFKDVLVLALTFWQIFSALHPKDILSLSRTSRVFRLTLSPSTARSVWRAALDKDGAPDCPSDWTEPRWAALLYDHHCQVCCILL